MVNVPLKTDPLQEEWNMDICPCNYVEDVIDHNFFKHYFYKDMSMACYESCPVNFLPTD